MLWNCIIWWSEACFEGNSGTHGSFVCLNQEVGPVCIFESRHTKQRKVLCSSNTGVWNYKPTVLGVPDFHAFIHKTLLHWVWFLSTWNMPSDVIICLRKVQGGEENILDFSCTDFTASCISTFFFFFLFFYFCWLFLTCIRPLKAVEA